MGNHPLSKYDSVSLLPPTILYALAALSTPEEVGEERFLRSISGPYSPRGVTFLRQPIAGRQPISDPRMEDGCRVSSPSLR